MFVLSAVAEDRLTAPERIAIRGSIPADLVEIEITYPEGHTPSVSLKGPKSPDFPALAPTETKIDVLVSEKTIVSFGGSTHEAQWQEHVVHISSQSLTDRPSGYQIFLSQPEMSLDVLSYGVLHVQGWTSGPFKLALADVAAYQRGDNVFLQQVEGSFDVRFPLRSVARRLDLRRLLSLVLFPQNPSSTVTVTSLVFERVDKARSYTPALGFWLWNYRNGIAQQDTIIADCQRFACTRLFVQLPSEKDPASLWIDYVQFLRVIKKSGIEAFAVDGYPEAINNPTPLLNKLQRLIELTDDGNLDGIQLDIEPYVLEDFFVDEGGFRRYLSVIDQVRNVLPKRVRFAIVMPFWFSSQKVSGRPVAFSVMDRADEVALMSYRTDVDELRALADDSLRYGDMVGSPVWLALETTPLPLEYHVVLRRTEERETADAYLDRKNRNVVFAAPPAEVQGEYFRTQQRFAVRPERLTFAKEDRQTVRAAVKTAFTSTPNPSLAGVIIHDWKGFFALKARR
ncbi:MAG: hypothetical protein AB7G75_08115 [Candidatus Binatia bacterium]